MQWFRTKYFLRLHPSFIGQPSFDGNAKLLQSGDGMHVDDDANIRTQKSTAYSTQNSVNTGTSGESESPKDANYLCDRDQRKQKIETRFNYCFCVIEKYE